MALKNLANLVVAFVPLVLGPAALAADFKVDSFSSDPPYVDARAPQSVTLEVAVPSTDATAIDLERLVGFRESSPVFRFITTLTGQGDGRFFGTVLFQPFCGVATLRLKTADDLVSEEFRLPSARAYFATAPVLDERTFRVELGSEFPQFLSVFDVPRAGVGILSVNNGARDHIAQTAGFIDLNGSVVVSENQLNSSVDCLEVPIPLQAGRNELRLFVDGGFPDAVALRVDALADAIDLQEPQNPVDLRAPLLEAEAEVTAAGLPVVGADVEFELDLPDESGVFVPATTDGAGVARLTFRDFGAPGEGLIFASVLRTPENESECCAISDEATFQIVEEPSVVLGQAAEEIVLRQGQVADDDVVISVRTQEQDVDDDVLGPAILIDEPWSLDFEQTIDPSGGLNSVVDFPTGLESGLEGVGPAILVLRRSLTGEETGTYRVRTAVTNQQTGETSVSFQTVHVVPADADAVAEVFVPTSFPATILPDTDTEVRFRVAFAGPTLAPDRLILEGDGIDPLDLADPDGDYVYQGATTISSGEAILSFTASTPEDFSQNAVSAPYELEVTDPTQLTDVVDLPGVRPDAQDGGFLESAEGNQFLEQQAIITPAAGVTAARIGEIVQEVRAEIIGFLPATQKYIVGKLSADTPEEVDELIEALHSFSEVAIAGRNYRIFNAAAFPDDGNFSAQENLTKVRAPEAWLVSDPANLDNPNHVAVLDTGVERDHPDLRNRIPGRELGADCALAGDPQQGGVFGDRDGHGTRVAGIVAADTNNAQQVAGVAGLGAAIKVVPVLVSGSRSSSVDNFHCAFEHLISCPRDASRCRIVNMSTYAQSDADDISAQQAGTTGDANLKDTIERALAAGILVVAAAGNGDIPEGKTPEDTRTQPAGYNDEIPGGRNNNNGLIAVGNTDNEDRRWTGNESSFFGSWIDMAAPGVEVTTTKILQGVAEGDLSGTSFSAPLVAGAAALYWSGHNAKSPSHVERRLKQSAAPLRPEEMLGAGRLDAAAAVANLGMELKSGLEGDVLANWADNEFNRCRIENVRDPAEFFSAQEGMRFLLCEDDDRSAAIVRAFALPAEIKKFRLTLKIAGMTRTNNMLFCTTDWVSGELDVSLRNQQPHTIRFLAKRLPGSTDIELSVAVDPRRGSQRNKKRWRLGSQECLGSPISNEGESTAFLLLDDIHFERIEQ